MNILLSQLRRPLRVAFAGSLSLLLCGVPTRRADAAETKKVFRAGAATSNITPFIGGSRNGSFVDRKSTYIHDELHARCLALDDGQTTLVLVVCDNCAITREIFDEAKRLVHEAIGLPMENMMLSATHTHSAGTAITVFQSKPDVGYPEFLSRRIADGIRRAVHNLEPARIGWGVAQEPKHVFNRRWYVKPDALPLNPFGIKDKVRMNPPTSVLIEPAGPVDPDVSVLSVVAINGRPIALYANYALHYVGAPAGHISADYFGAFAGNIERRLAPGKQDPAFVGILSNGASGDINNNNFRNPGPPKPPYHQVELVADDIAKAAESVVRNLKYQDWVPLSVRQSDLRLGVRKPGAEELARARELVAQMQRKGAGKVPTRDESYAQESIELLKYPDEVPVLVQALRIGDLGLAAIPCEIFVEIGLEVKQKAPFKHTIVVNLANGYNGYLPTVGHHELGGYETWRARSAYLEVQAAPKITAELLSLFEQLERARQE